MKTPFVSLILATLTFGLVAYGQNSPQNPPPAPQAQATQSKHATAKPAKGQSVGGDLGRGSGDIGKGAAEGTGKAAEGVGKGAVDLATLHPVGAAADLGKGAAGAGKDVGVGAVKGTGKIAKGAGKLIAKPFHHSRKNENGTP